MSVPLVISTGNIGVPTRFPYVPLPLSGFATNDKGFGGKEHKQAANYHSKNIHF